MSRYCLDTSAYSHFQHGDSQAIGLIDRAEWVGMPAIVLGELRPGFQIVTDLRRRGKPLPTNDMWIAVTGARADTILLTYDEHFDAMSRVGSVLLIRE